MTKIKESIAKYIVTEPKQIQIKYKDRNNSILSSKDEGDRINTKLPSSVYPNILSNMVWRTESTSSFTNIVQIHANFDE